MAKGQETEEENMGIFMQTLVFLSGYVNKKNIVIVMTYLYLLTIIVLIKSNSKLSADHIMKSKYLTRSLRQESKPFDSLYPDELYDDIEEDFVENVGDKKRNEKLDEGKKGNGVLQTGDAKGLEKKDNLQVNAKHEANIVKKHAETHLIGKHPNALEVGKETIGKNNEQDTAKKIVQNKAQVKEPVDIKKNLKEDKTQNEKKVKAMDKTGNAIDENENPLLYELSQDEKKQENNKIWKYHVLKQTTKYPGVELIDNFKFRNNPKEREETWQSVTRDQTYMIFSAVYDVFNGQPYVRALAINGNTFMPKFFCELTYKDGVIVTLKGRTWMLPDHHEKQYKPLFLYCPLPDDRVPAFLSVVAVYDPQRLNKLPVMHFVKEERKFTVCLAPLFFNYSIEYELVQWFELNKLIGADYFMVYNYSTVGRTDEILNHYQKLGWVKVVQWHLPEHTDLHYFGQIAMINDCLFRNIRISRYMVNIDLDEFIVPRRGMTDWSGLLSSQPQDFCEYSFRSCFMPRDSPEVFEGKQKARELHLNALLRISRREYIFDKNVRSKYIVNTTCIDTVGIHFCWKYKNGTEVTQRYHVFPREALMYHFRKEPVAKIGKEVEEKAIYKYHTDLIKNAENRWKAIAEEKQVKKPK